MVHPAVEVYHENSVQVFEEMLARSHCAISHSSWRYPWVLTSSHPHHHLSFSTLEVSSLCPALGAGYSEKATVAAPISAAVTAGRPAVPGLVSGKAERFAPSDTPAITGPHETCGFGVATDDTIDPGKPGRASSPAH